MRARERQWRRRMQQAVQWGSRQQSSRWTASQSQSQSQSRRWRRMPPRSTPRCPRGASSGTARLESTPPLHPLRDLCQGGGAPAIPSGEQAISCSISLRLKSERSIPSEEQEFGGFGIWRLVGGRSEAGERRGRFFSPSVGGREEASAPLPISSRKRALVPQPYLRGRVGPAPQRAAAAQGER